MTVRVLLFSVLRDAAGTGEASFQIPEGSGVDFLLNAVFDRWPGLRPWDASLLVAVDHSYVKREATLHEGSEVAIMPPVQGG